MQDFQEKSFDFQDQYKSNIYDTQKVKVLSLPGTITKEKSMFRAKALRRELIVPSLEMSIFPLSFQIVREPLPFAYH